MKSDSKHFIMSGRNSVTYQKSRVFARRIVRLYQYLCKEKNEYTISEQLKRSGTSIGANLAESLYAASRADFSNKIQISLKECSETIYWIELLYDTDYISEEMFDSIMKDCCELLRLLTSSARTSHEHADSIKKQK